MIIDIIKIRHFLYTSCNWSQPIIFGYNVHPMKLNKQQQTNKQWKKQQPSHFSNYSLIDKMIKLLLSTVIPFTVCVVL